MAWWQRRGSAWRQRAKQMGARQPASAHANWRGPPPRAAPLAAHLPMLNRAEAANGWQHAAAALVLQMRFLRHLHAPTHLLRQHASPSLVLGVIRRARVVVVLAPPATNARKHRVALRGEKGGGTCRASAARVERRVERRERRTRPRHVRVRVHVAQANGNPSAHSSPLQPAPHPSLQLSPLSSCRRCRRQCPPAVRRCRPRPPPPAPAPASPWPPLLAAP